MVRCIIHDFYDASGLSVNLHKSKVFFSGSVSKQWQECISIKLGIAGTTNLGKYLWVPILHGYGTHGVCDFTLDKLNRKLAGWKSTKLSLTRQITLTKSALNTIEGYYMSLTTFPSSICNKIDQFCNKSIWGSSLANGKAHLVGRLIFRGGFNIKPQKLINKAYMMKLFWHVITGRNSARVQLIRDWYGYNERSCTKALKNVSPLMGNLQKIWDQTVANVFWQLGNRKNILFWKDT